MTSLGSLIIFSKRYQEAVAFYKALGLPLEDEAHSGGPVHHACDLGEVHLAIFDASGSAGDRAPTYRSAGSSYVGFRVASLGERIEALRAAGVVIRQEPESYPWGLRALIEDPDGRVVELFEAAGRGAESGATAG